MAKKQIELSERILMGAAIGGACVVLVLMMARPKGLSPLPEQKESILKALELCGTINGSCQPEEIQRLYPEKIVEAAVNASGVMVQGRRSAEVRSQNDLFPLFVYREKGKVMAYCFPSIFQKSETDVQYVVFRQGVRQGRAPQSHSLEHIPQPYMLFLKRTGALRR